MEREWILAIQHMQSPLLDRLFSFVTILGMDTFFILLFAIIYWCLSKEDGEFIAFSAFLSAAFNGAVKDLVRRERPIGLNGVRSLMAHTATGYSFPSGHGQNSAAFYGSLSMVAGKRWFSVLMGAVVFLIGFSRVYLGVHYPSDVLAGFALGLLAAFSCRYLFKRVKNRAPMYLLFALMMTAPVFYRPSPDTCASIGCCYALPAAVWFERRFVRFELPQKVWQGVARVLLGLALALLIKEGLKLVFPAHVIFTALRYALLVFICMGLYPMCFKPMKI